jgi:hypothetical protein
MKTLTGVIALVLALLFAASNGVVAAEKKQPPEVLQKSQPPGVKVTKRATKACPADKVPGKGGGGGQGDMYRQIGGWVKCDCDEDGTFERECGTDCCTVCCAAAAGDPVIRKIGLPPPPRPLDPKGLPVPPPPRPFDPKGLEGR